MNVKRLFFNSAIKIGYLIAFFIILMATLVVTSRLITPLLNHSRHFFEEKVGAFVGLPVRISYLRADWRGFSPDLKFENVDIYNPGQKEIVLHADAIEVDIDLIHSILNKTVKLTNIDISGVNLTVNQSSNKEFTVDGFQQIAAQNTDSNQKLGGLAWILSQPEISLSHSNILLMLQSGQTIPFLVNTIQIKNQPGLHRCRGQIQIQNKIPTQLDFNGLVNGDEAALARAKMTIYANIQHASLGQWAVGKNIDGYDIQQGDVDAQVWMTLQDGKIQTVQLLPKIKNLQLLAGEKTISILNLSGNFLWKNTTDGGQFLGDNVQLNHMYFKSGDSSQGIDNLSGHLEWSHRNGSATVYSQNSKLFFSYSQEPVALNSLTGTLFWNQNEKGDWIVKIPEIAASNDDVTAQAKAEFLIPFHHPERTIVNLSSDYRLKNSNIIKNYLPHLVMDAELDTWLSQAFSGDQPLNGTAVIRGAISDFPFDHSKNGIFLADVKLQGINLHYDADWPDVKNMSGDLIFDKRQMRINIDQGVIADAHINTIKAMIPYLGKGDQSNELTVDSEMDTNAEQLFDFVNQSPLKNTVGEGLKSIHLEGNVGVNLHLFIPISCPQDIKVSGHLNLPDDQLSVPEWRIQVDHFLGDISFTDDFISSKNLKGFFMDEPVNFQVATLQKPKQLQISMDSQIDMKSLLNYLQWKNIPYFDGKTAYHANLSVGLSEDDSAQNSLVVHSDLQGIQMDLPDPLGKTKEQIKPFDFKLYFGGGQSLSLFLTLQNQLSAALSFKENQKTQSMEFYSGHILVGGKQVILQDQPGWFIDGDLPVFDAQTWQSWKTFFKNNQSQTNQAITSNIKNQLHEVSLNIGKIDLFNQQCESAQIKLMTEMRDWKISIDSPTTKGYLLWPYHYPSETLIGQFEELDLSSGKDSSNLSTVDPGSIPPLHLVVNQLHYNQKPLGVVDLKIHPDKNTLVIDNATFKSPMLTGTVVGRWQLFKDHTYQTHLSGTLESNNVSGLLDQNNVHSSVIIKSGKMIFELNWPDVINHFDISKATGHIFAHMNKGRIIDLGEQANNKLDVGRLLTLLSVQRLITMDFSDLAQRGYGFDKMVGDFDLNNGNLTTHNLSMDGAVAYIGVDGQIHTPEKTLDLKVEVDPHLTSSLPVVATLVGGPVVGAVTWAANKMVGNMVSHQLAHYQYQITGDWSKPLVKPIQENQSGDEHG